MADRGALLVVSGTGGAGKGTVVDQLRARFPELWWSVSWATRLPRPGERDGDHYWFHTTDEFIAVRDADGFLEWADVYGVLKGTPAGPLEAVLNGGQDALLEMDIQGACNVAQRYPDAAIVFLTAPTADIQAERLRGRSTDSEADIQRRLDEAASEEATARTAGFHVLVNHNVDQVVSEITAILTTSRARLSS